MDMRNSEFEFNTAAFCEKSEEDLCRVRVLVCPRRRRDQVPQDPYSLCAGALKASCGTLLMTLDGKRCE